MAESRYEKHCREVCQWCAGGDKGDPVKVSGVRWHGGEPEYMDMDEGYPCTAPTLPDFAEAQAIRVEEAERHLGNLLAVIQGDGGHYQSEHGTAKAASDAEGWCIAERRALEEAERKLAEVEAKRDEYLHIIQHDLNWQIHEAENALVDIGGLEDFETIAMGIKAICQERASLKAQMAGARVCSRCYGKSGGGHDRDWSTWPACKAGIVWPQEVKP